MASSVIDQPRLRRALNGGDGSGRVGGLVGAEEVEANIGKIESGGLVVVK